MERIIAIRRGANHREFAPARMQHAIALEAYDTQRESTETMLMKRGLFPQEHYASLFQFDNMDGFSVALDSEHDVLELKAELGDSHFIFHDVEMVLPTGLDGGSKKGSCTGEKWAAQTGVPKARNAGITGKNVVIGVLDTGIDMRHREFKGRNISCVFVPEDDLEDLRMMKRNGDKGKNGHGTSVCSIAAGSHMGVAPGADLLVASVIESSTMKTSLFRVLRGITWFLGKVTQIQYSDFAYVLNLSFGFPEDSLKKLGQEIEDLEDGLEELLKVYDVLVAAAIGNSGPGKMHAPGLFEEVLGVGACTHGLDPRTSSGGGQVARTGLIKPDLCGLGVDICSAIPGSTGDQYQRKSGTSMACPYVSGIAALIAQQTGLKGDDLRDELYSRLLKLNHPADRVGAGFARFG